MIVKIVRSMLEGISDRFPALDDLWAVSPKGEIQKFSLKQYLALDPRTDERIGWKWALSERHAHKIAREKAGDNG